MATSCKMCILCSLVLICITVVIGPIIYACLIINNEINSSVVDIWEVDAEKLVSAKVVETWSNETMLESIRRIFLTIAQQNEDKFHPKDVERVKSEDWTIQRFMLVNKEAEDEVLKALVKTMEWRKSFGVNDFTDEYFPQEIYKIGEVSILCNDIESRPIVWQKLSHHYKSPEFGLIMRQFFVYIAEKADRNTTNQGWAAITDSTGFGYSNVDMDASNFGIDILQNHYPRGMKYMVGVDIPWLMKYVANAVIAFMNDELKSTIRFIDSNQLPEYMDKKFIPVHLGGLYTKDIVAIPLGAKPLKEFTDLTGTKFTSEQIKNIRYTFSEWLK